MCTSPIRILNNSTFFKPGSGQKLYRYVACGHCLECRRQRQNEWRIRTYFEALSTLQTKNGYVLFDTLTYSDQFLPHVNDFIDVPKDLNFPCFSANDIQRFMKRLRILLTRAGYDPKDYLRFFIVSEFGSDSRYSHRPHYHSFFFVRNGFVPALVLSRFVSQAWSEYNFIDKSYTPLGRTDGVLYRGSSYVLNHNTFSDLESSKRCLMYVSKYVSKDFQFSDLSRNRLFKIMDYYFPGFDWSVSKSMRGFYDMVKGFVLPFHRQSKNYGISPLVDYYGKDNLLKSGSFVFNVSGLPMNFSLFPSLKRNLFYDYERDIKGRVSWKLNYQGKLFKLHHLLDEVKRLDNRIANYNLNNTEKIAFSSFDFVFNQNSSLVNKLKMDDVYRSTLNQFFIDNKNAFRNYFSVNYDYLKQPFMSKLDYGSKSGSFFYPGKPIEITHSLDSIDVYLDAIPLLFDSDMDSQYYKLLRWESFNGKKLLQKQRFLDINKNKLKHLCLI